MPAGDARRLVKQVLGRHVREPGALGPGQRPQREHQRLRRPGAPRPPYQICRDRVVTLRICYDALVYLPSVYYEVCGGLYFNQRFKLPRRL
ncbi:hypothetical protein Prum_091410 [Phytohabitans rumicis]|uniref:Uncharacterized protein n=1 Tax=Phytohabitans rumicis TaxID=1076125 RepID=A0A6V8LLJ7_9ACTN|nr:hypothetical protein Prum_091410 [Phytohabitans rumicis]